MSFIYKKLINNLKSMYFKRKQRKINSHNYTHVKNIFDIKKVVVKRYTYGPLNIKTYGNKNEKLIIGSFCSIACDVKFLLGGEHLYNHLSTFPFL